MLIILFKFSVHIYSLSFFSLLIREFSSSNFEIYARTCTEGKWKMGCFKIIKIFQVYLRQYKGGQNCSWVRFSISVYPVPMKQSFVIYYLLFLFVPYLLYEKCLLEINSLKRLVNFRKKYYKNSGIDVIVITVGEDIHSPKFFFEFALGNFTYLQEVFFLTFQKNSLQNFNKKFFFHQFNSFE